MKQLGVLDSAFVNLEHPNTPQHIGGLGIYDPSTAPEGFVRFKGVIASFERRLQKHSIFRSRLVKTPANFDRPYWVKDANFDVEFHIRHLALPKPGDWRQLCILVSRLHARPLDMARPLWEAYIIEGLDNIPGVPEGGFAIYTKIHHALVDGAGGSNIMAVIHDLEADPEGQVEEPTTIEVDTLPNALQLGTSTVINHVKNAAKLATGTVGTLKGFGKMALGIANKSIPMPPISPPRTRFNNPVSPYRVFEAAEFDLEDVKMIKNVTGTKVNDVMLAIVSGALRRYLDHHKELPEESLAVTVPLNMRTRKGENDDNNQVGSVFMSLATDLDDPLERLAAIHQSAGEAKSFGEQSPLVDALRLAGVMPPAITRPLVKTYIDNQLTQHLPLGISSVVSNVAGPPFPLYCAGAKLCRYYGLGLLTPGVGIFHLVYSSVGVVTLSILGDRSSMPDPAFYRECVEASFAELHEAAQKLQAEKHAGGAAAAAKPSSGDGAKAASAPKASKKAAAATRQSPRSGSSAKSATPAKSAKKAAQNTPRRKPRAKKATASAGSGHSAPSGADRDERVDSLFNTGESNVVSLGKGR